MDIFQQIGDAIHDFLVNLVGGVFIQIFNEANEQIVRLGKGGQGDNQ